MSAILDTEVASNFACKNEDFRSTVMISDKLNKGSYP